MHFYDSAYISSPEWPILCRVWR